MTVAVSCPTHTSAFGEELAAAWPQFVNCTKRQETMLPFLRANLPRGRSRALDLGCGSGCEVSGLARDGRVAVTANEIDAYLHDVAREQAGALRQRIAWAATDWRELSSAFGDEQFDLAFLVGNSFPLLLGEIDRTCAAAEIYRVCKTGGRFAVDVRNFDYILNDRESILRGWFRYSARVVYCGTEVTGRPVAYTDTLVTFGYFSDDGRLLGTLDMVPLTLDRLTACFVAAGFRVREVLSDLKSGYDPRADFFTLVLEK